MALAVEPIIFNKMPKLLQINVTANWGSTGKIAESIGIRAIEHGWESYIAYGRYSNPSKSKLIRVGSNLETYIHFGLQRIFDNEGLNSNNATYRLIKKMEVIKPEIVHLHNIHDHFLNYKLLFEYLNKTDTKVVWTFHDCWAFTGHCFHFVIEGCMKWKNHCYKCPQKNGLIDRSTKNFLLKKSLFSESKNLTIVPCSHWMASFVKESFLKERDIKIIHNGVDLKIFKPICEKKKDDKFRIIAVSNVWPPYKGLGDIIKLRSMLSSNYIITVVGLTAYQVQVLPVGIQGIQRTQNIQELVALYNEANVLINPTYSDTFPTVNLEALACGTPVITYKTGGSPEAVDERTGIVINQGDVTSLANAIMWLKKNPFSSEACRQHAEKNFDKEKCFEDYIKLYEELLTE